MMKSIASVLEWSFIGFTVADMLIIIACIIGALILDRITQWIVTKIAQRIKAKHSENTIQYALVESINRPLHMLFLTLGCSLGLLIIEPPAWGIKLFAVLRLIISSLSIWCVIWYLLRVTDHVSDFMAQKAAQTDSKLDDMVIPLVRGVIKFMLFAIGVLVILQNMGYSVSSLLAGLGIGGAALALAAKDTIANFFGSLVVFLDRPFDLGDWVKIGGVEGTIEEIRVRTTLIRAFDGSVIMIPNSALTNANINNFQRRKLRRLDANFGVYYSTKAEQVEKIVADVKKYVAAHPEMLDPKCYVGFSGFGDSSLDIFVTVYSVKTGWADYCEIRQTLLLAIMRIVQEAGTGFAFPTRTLEFAPGNLPYPNAIPQLSMDSPQIISAQNFDEKK